MKWKSRYHQEKTKLRFSQCQGEKVYFGFDKDCDNCPGKVECYTTKARPFGVDVLNTVLVFAETKEEAESYAARGHGRDLPEYRGVVRVMPYMVEAKGNGILIVPELDML